MAKSRPRNVRIKCSNAVISTATPYESKSCGRLPPCRPQRKARRTRKPIASEAASGEVALCRQPRYRERLGAAVPSVAHGYDPPRSSGMNQRSGRAATIPPGSADRQSTRETDAGRVSRSSVRDIAATGGRRAIVRDAAICNLRRTDSDSSPELSAGQRARAVLGHLPGHGPQRREAAWEREPPPNAADVAVNQNGTRSESRDAWVDGRGHVPAAPIRD